VNAPWWRVDRLAAIVAIAAAVGAVAVAVRFESFVAGGSDSACYLSGARLLAHGAVRSEQPLARAAPWPRAAATFTPAGHIPSPADPAAVVPICPPGLPLLMAVSLTLARTPFLVVPLLGALTVWLAFVVGRSVDRPFTGAAAAVLTACSPIFLYQVVQPMTDVPAAAWWLLAIACTVGTERRTPRPLAAGLAVSMAVLTRPNLVPLAGVLLVYLLVTAARDRRLRIGAAFGLGLAPGVIALAVIQHAMYGSALATGYGAPERLFALSNVLPNFRRYSLWLFSTHTPLLLLAAAAPVILRRRAEAAMLLIFALATLACYLPYVVFNDWWYIRFLLPAIPPLVILSVAVLREIARRVAGRLDTLAAAGAVCALGIAWILAARSGRAFEVGALERHYRNAGRYVADRLPERAAIITVKNSGSVHYYAGRPTLSWDTLEPQTLDTVLAFLRDQKYQPYLLLESDEEPAFRARFSGSAAGGLDWPPAAQIGRTIRIYDPADRARFFADGRVRTDFVSTDSR
jgi:hypothetical protein